MPCPRGAAKCRTAPPILLYFPAFISNIPLDLKGRIFFNPGAPPFVAKPS